MGSLTLVIGSGGMGVSVIREAVLKAQQRLEPDFNTYMKFIAVDADISELMKIEKEIGRTAVRCLNISSPGAALRFQHNAREDFYRTFIPSDLEAGNLDHYGSGQIRMNGKVKFYDRHVKGGYNDKCFRDIISGIFNTEWEALKGILPVDIMILAGLSGGTGSGTFEELAAHARYVCEKTGAAEVRVFGYLFLPDTMEEIGWQHQEYMERCRANGYAALKELENYMSFGQDRKEFFAAHDAEISVGNGKRLFDYSTLISGTYSGAISMIADFIVHLASAGDFNQLTLLHSNCNNRYAYLCDPGNLETGLLKQGFFPEDSHRYSSIGYARAGIPDEIVKANIVDNVCRRIHQPSGRSYFEQELSREEREAQIRELFGLNVDQVLTVSSLWEQKIIGLLDRASQLPENMIGISRREVLSGEIEAYRAGFRENEVIVHGIQEAEKQLKCISKDFVTVSYRVMETYGPWVMKALFYGYGSAGISIADMLHYVKEKLQRIPYDNVPQPSYEERGGVLSRLLSHAVEEWKEKFRDAVQHGVKRKIAEKILETDGIWENGVERNIASHIEQCDSFAERLESTVRFYRSKGWCLEEDSYGAFAAAVRGQNRVNLCSDAQAYAWVRMNIRNYVNSIDEGEVRRRIIRSFAEDPSRWTVENGKFSEQFLLECCGLGTDDILPVTAYLGHMLGSMPPEECALAAGQLAARILAGLLDKSRSALRKRENSWCAVNQRILIPQSLQASPYGGIIIHAFQTALEARRISPDALGVSQAASEIICCQVSVANALCDLKDIDEWERAYDHSNASDKSCRHLINGEPGYAGSFCELTKQETEDMQAVKEGRQRRDLQLTAEEEVIFGMGLSQEHYPPVTLHNLENNESEKKFRETVFDPIVNYALKENLIERIPEYNPNSYRYVVNLIPKEWKNLDVSAYDLVGDDGRLQKGTPLFQYLQRQNACENAGFQKEICLEGGGFLSEGYDFTMARQASEGRTQEEIDKISIEYMKRILRKDTGLFVELRETLCRYYDIDKALRLKAVEKKDSWQMIDKINREVSAIFETGRRERELRNDE